MRRVFSFFILMLAMATQVLSQTSQKLTLEDIYQNNKFKTNTVQGLRWMNDGNFYTALVNNRNTQSPDIIKYSTATGEVVDTLVLGRLLITDQNSSPIRISSYQFSGDESKILISSEEEKIYRRSTKSINYVYDLKTNQIRLLVSGDKQSFASFSPKGNQVAFVRDNNLFVKNLDVDKLISVTTDGKKNEIINGMADWVYEEELSLSKAFFWSPDGKKIAYLKFDESEVPVYNLQLWNGLYPEDYTYKYPKAGEKNAVVRIYVYNLETRQTIEIPRGDNADIYIARLKWLPDASTLSFIRLNRLQNKLEIIHGDVATGSTNILYTDQSDKYIDIDQIDDLTYISDGKSFIMSSEKTGFKHLYHYNIDGQLIGQITSGDWSISEFFGIIEKKDLLYFTSTSDSPLQKQLYQTDLKGEKTKKISKTPGTHSINFSHDYKYYVDTYSSLEEPGKVTLHTATGKQLKLLAENNAYLEKVKEYGYANPSLFKVPINGDSLNGYIIKPLDFESTKKYPLLMYVYGGPGSQRVLDKWNDNLYHQYLVQQGYIVACVDNRGTGGRGRDFQQSTYKQLGKFETADLIAAAKYMGNWSFIDKNRIGIWGWSYGGYMSSLSILLGNEVFKAAIAVAPVTNWRFYDSIYTERYLQKPDDNPGGYDDYSPQKHAEKLKGAFLLIHGTGDDNVHYQNAIELQNALIKANKQFTSFFYPDRNHSISGGNTSLHLYTLMSDFILGNL